MSLRVPFALSFLVLFSVACSGDDDAGTDGNDGNDTDTGAIGDDDDDDDDTTSSTITIDAQFLTVVAGFAYDDATNMIVPYEDPNYGPQPITLSVLISDSSTQQSQPSVNNTCTVSLTTNTPLPLVAVDDIGAWWGFEMPADADVSTECFVTLPEAFGDDPAVHVTKWTWGVAIDELDGTVAQQLEQQLQADWPGAEPFVIGGGGFTSAFEGVLNDEGYLIGYGQAFAADGNFGIEVDPTGYGVELYADQVWDGKTPARGVYLMASGSVGPADLITR